MSEFANEKNNDNGIEIKKNVVVNGQKTKLSLDNEYDFKGEKTKWKIKDIIKKGKFTEYPPKILRQPLNFILVPNNVNSMTYRKNKFDFNNARVPNSSKIMQYKFTNRTKSNINHTKLDIKSSPFDPKNVEYKKDFNNYVASMIANHKKPVMYIGGDALCIRNYAFTFDNSEDIELNEILYGLWINYSYNKKIYIEYDMAVKKKICVLNEDNKSNLLKLIDEIKFRIDLNDFVSQNEINSNNFDAKFDEFKKEYREKNISPIAACYFLSAIKKKDLTTERLNKVWNEVNTNLWHSFSIGSDDNRLISLMNNLMDGNFRFDECLDIFIFCLRLDMRFKYPDEPEDLYNIIYGIITNSENYKQANGDKKKETTAIKNFFDPHGCFKKFWITLGELNANIHPAYKRSYSEILTMRNMKELARYSENEYSRKLSNLLSDHDIYISPTTEKIKDDKEKEVDQICIKVDSYQAVQTQAKKDFDEYMKKVIYDLKNDQNVKYDWVRGNLIYNKKRIYNFKNVKFYDEKGNRYNTADETLQFVALVAKFYCQDHKLPSYGFDLALFSNDVKEIQNIVGEKQKAKIKELINGFSEFVDEKIEKHKKQEEPLFRLEGISICDYKYRYNLQDTYGFVMVDDLAKWIVEEFTKEYFTGRFYMNIDIKKIEEQENKLKALFNDEIKKHVEKNKLNYEYNEYDSFWDEIPKKNVEVKVEQQAKQKDDLENKKSNNNVSENENENPVINLHKDSDIGNKIENELNNKIEEKLIERENINEDEYVEVLVNGVLKKATESLAKEKNEIKNETKTMKNNIIIQNNNQIEHKIDEKQNNKQDNDINVGNITTKRMEIDEMNEEKKADNNNKNDDESVSSEVENKEGINSDYDQKNQKEDINSNKSEDANENKLQKSNIFQEAQIGIDKSNDDKSNNQKEIETNKGEESRKITKETEYDTTKSSNDGNKAVKTEMINIEINSNKTKEVNLYTSTLQTSSLANPNNRNQSGTKNKGWIKFLTVLELIALIGCILALVMTVASIFVEILSIATIKFTIAAVVLFFVFVMSKLLVSCLSDKKMKENKNPYPEQINTCIKQKENQNEFNINNLVNNELNINQIGEQEKNNVSSIEDSLD